MKILKWIVLIVISLILLLIFAIEGMYFYGLRVLPQDISPTSKVFSTRFLQAQWVALEGDHAGEIVMPLLSPLQIVASLWVTLIKKNGQEIIVLPIGTRLASQNARELLQRSKEKNVHKYWHLNNISTTIWIANNWSAQEALNSLLDSSFYGYGYFGLEAAAQGYFEKKQADLNDYEMALLIGLLKGPSYYDPRCRKDRAVVRMNQIIKRLSIYWPAEYGDLKEQLQLPKSLVAVKLGACKRV